MKHIKNHKNEKYGRLKVIEFVKRENSKSYWKCKCDCGNEITLPITYLTTGDTKSCGCLRKEMVAKLSKSKSFVKNKRLYNIWIGMRRRCLNNKRNNYKYYGAKGIEICNEWKNNFNNFQNWALNNGYNDYLTIDRINIDNNYEPNNCRWVTKFDQNNNKNGNHKILYEGKEYNTMSSFCREYNINYDKFRQYIRKGYAVDQALNICIGVK